MTGLEHYAEAERWVYKAENEGARGELETAESCAAIGQVHATLAGVWAHNRVTTELSNLLHTMLDQIREARETQT